MTVVALSNVAIDLCRSGEIGIHARLKIVSRKG